MSELPVIILIGLLILASSRSSRLQGRRLPDGRMDRGSKNQSRKNVVHSYRISV